MGHFCFVHARLPFFAHRFHSFFISLLLPGRASSTEVERETRKREESKNVIYTWNEKAVFIVQTTPVISDYDN